MNRKALLDSIGSVFRIRPNPIVTKTKKPIKEAVNSWTFISFPEQKTLVFKHNHSDYRIEVPALYVSGHEPPDMIVLRGQIFLDDSLKFSFEPFTEGMSAAGDPAELVDDPMGRHSGQLYATLKPHEGKLVSIRFPKGDDGTVYGPNEATLQEVTPHFAKLQVEELRIFVINKYFVTPAYTKTISLSFIKFEEDDEKENRPRLVTDHSHWEPEL